MLGVVPEGDQDYPDKAGWITIPYITPLGGVVDIRFRRPPGSTHPAKYKSLPNASPRLYNTTATLIAGDTLCVTEGEADAWILTQCGLHAVAVPGAANWSAVMGLALQGFDNIIVCEDGDDTGAGAALSTRITKQLEWASIVRFEGHDVTSYFLEHGGAELHAKVTKPIQNVQTATATEYEE